MSRSNPLRVISRPGLFLSLTRLDWFALYLATLSVLLFGVSMMMSSQPGESMLHKAHVKLWHGNTGEGLVSWLLLVFLALEVVLVFWLWLEFPKRRRAETALRKMHSLQRAIARSSARIVSMTPEELEEGLHQELDGIREMLGIDRICWYQQTADGNRFTRLQTASAGIDVPGRDAFTAASNPWLVSSILRGLPAHMRTMSDMPVGSEKDRESMEPSGMKSFALVPSTGGPGAANALMLTSFSKEIDWDEEVVAQLSVLASVFANAQARKLAEVAGTESELRFRRLFEEAPIGCCLVDTEGRICVANAAIHQMLGYGEGELPGKAFWEITVTEDISKSLVHFHELISGVRDFYQLEKRYLKKDGAVIWGRLTVSILGARSERGPFVLAMVEDVTEAVRSRDQLEQNRRKLTLALEASRMTAWEYDPASARISWVDRNTLREFGNRPVGPVMFADVLQHVHPEDRTTLLELASRIMNEGGSFSAEFRMFGKDGSIRWMLGKGERVAEGETNGRIAGVTIDVSELKRAQIELRELAKRLMAAQEEERKRISRELHDDIGQRVALLAIELDLLRQLLNEQESLRERVERAQTATGELGTDLHQLSHALHSSKLQYLGLPAALRELCNRVADKHALVVELECDVQKVTLAEDDALALFRVAQEALNNVVRHSRATQARVVLSCIPNELLLMVCDNGRGFDPGRRTAGIGLIGMRERMRAVRGDFQIISTPGGGTEIHAKVTLPAPAPQPQRIQFDSGTVQ